MPKRMRQAADDVAQAPARTTRRTTRRKTARGDAAAAASAGTGDVVVRTADGKLFKVALGPALQQAAYRWNFVLRNRRRWAGTSTSDRQTERARDTLEQLGVAAAELDAIASQIADAGTVEVSVPWTEERSGWEARILPWEHILATATRRERSGRALTIVRHLSVRAPGAVRVPAKVLYVESAPCDLRDQFTFDAEERLVRLAFSHDGRQGAPIEFEVLRDPTRESLRSRVAQFAPDVVHVAGVDSHQAHRLLPALRDAEGGERRPRIADGVLLQTDDGRPDCVPAGEFSRLLTAADVRPSLVAFNVFNSASRLAAMAVAHGAGAATGYQDDFDDRLAEVFYERLYWAWSEDREDLLSAFSYAWSEVRRRGVPVGGTGVVLWGGASWLARGVADAAKRRFADRGAEDRRRILPTPPADAAQEMVTADVKPRDSLNYSIVHNAKERPVFERFVIAKPRGRIRDLSVSVALHLADHTTSFELTSTIDDPKWSDTPVDLAHQVSVPLVSPLLRSLRDSTKSFITVRVTWGPHVVHHRSHQVTLLAIDEWRDDDDHRIWLPSFVLPGDPAVRRVVEAARRYLVALTDDPHAGFDGYQSGDAEVVDAQAQAIWNAIVQDFGLGYVNPPPGGAASSQRLRTPGAVVESRHGTCIDLALLYAACLEYIDVWPCLVLLRGHAFPAYWRTEAAHAEFERLSPAEVSGAESPAGRAAEGDAADAGGAAAEDSAAGEGGTGGSAGARRGPWVRERWAHPWIVDRVRAGDLVPLETVFLTTRTGFEAALEEGRANLASAAEFDSIQDVRIARAHDVTPLPLHDGGRP